MARPKKANAKATVVEATPVVETTPAVTKKAAAPKRPARKTTATKKTAETAVTTNTEVYIQFLGKEIFAKDLVENIKKAWADANGKKVEDITDLKVYVKPEEHKAYYVVNGEMTSAYDL